MECINAKYISQKISKTRWRPVSAASLQQPEVFATGSWDNEARTLTSLTRFNNVPITFHCYLTITVCFQNNRVSIWSLGDYGGSHMDGEFEEDPQLLCESKHDGDVMDLQVRRDDRKQSPVSLKDQGSFDFLIHYVIIIILNSFMSL